jgi:hypothetical protein
MKVITMSFTRSYRRKAAGWRRATTATVFDHAWLTTGDLIAMDTGSGPIAAGIGIQTSPSVGLPITMGDGPVCVAQDGAGCQAVSGLRLGSPGENTAIGVMDLGRNLPEFYRAPEGLHHKVALQRFAQFPPGQPFGI